MYADKDKVDKNIPSSFNLPTIKFTYKQNLYVLENTRLL